MEAGAHSGGGCKVQVKTTVAQSATVMVMVKQDTGEGGDDKICCWTRRGVQKEERSQG